MICCLFFCSRSLMSEDHSLLPNCICPAHLLLSYRIMRTMMPVTDGSIVLVNDRAIVCLRYSQPQSVFPNFHRLCVHDYGMVTQYGLYTHLICVVKLFEKENSKDEKTPIINSKTFILKEWLDQLMVTCSVLWHWFIYISPYKYGKMVSLNNS